MPLSWALELSLDSNDDNGLELFEGRRSLGRLHIEADFSGGMSQRRVRVPNSAAATGYDRVRIQPDRGDGEYRIGHLLLAD